MRTFSTRLEMIQALPPGAIGVEVGVYRADFSQQIMLQTKTAYLYLVDPWIKQENYHDTINEEDQEGHYQETLRKLRPFIKEGRVTVIRDFSKNAAANPDLPPFNYAFIDGYHAYESALEDLTLWSKKLVPFGTLYAHDYFEGPKYGHDGHEWRSGVVKACADFCAANGWEVTGITTEDLPTARLERKQ